MMSWNCQVEICSEVSREPSRNYKKQQSTSCHEWHQEVKLETVEAFDTVQQAPQVPNKIQN